VKEKVGKWECEEKGSRSGAVLIPCRLEAGLDTSTDTTEFGLSMNGDGSSMSKGDRGNQSDPCLDLTLGERCTQWGV